jgi:hypothetical protein
MIRADAGAAAGTRVTVAERAGPVRCAKGLRVLPGGGFADHPPLDVLVVPGGPGARPPGAGLRPDRLARNTAADASWVTRIPLVATRRALWPITESDRLLGTLHCGSTADYAPEWRTNPAARLDAPINHIWVRVLPLLPASHTARRAPVCYRASIHGGGRRIRGRSAVEDRPAGRSSLREPLAREGQTGAERCARHAHSVRAS